LKLSEVTREAGSTPRPAPTGKIDRYTPYNSPPASPYSRPQGAGLADDIAGWITLDPTNRSVGGFNLIPVAVARDIRHAMPVAGSFAGPTEALLEMSVEVLVTAP
jgi:hypothetical protein